MHNQLTSGCEGSPCPPFFSHQGARPCRCGNVLTIPADVPRLLDSRIAERPVCRENVARSRRCVSSQFTLSFAATFLDSIPLSSLCRQLRWSGSAGRRAALASLVPSLAAAKAAIQQHTKNEKDLSQQACREFQPLSTSFCFSPLFSASHCPQNQGQPAYTRHFHRSHCCCSAKHIVMQRAGKAGRRHKITACQNCAKSLSPTFDCLRSSFSLFPALFARICAGNRLDVSTSAQRCL